MEKELLTIYDGGTNTEKKVEGTVFLYTGDNNEQSFQVYIPDQDGQKQVSILIPAEMVTRLILDGFKRFIGMK